MARTPTVNKNKDPHPRQLSEHWARETQRPMEPTLQADVGLQDREDFESSRREATKQLAFHPKP